MSETHRGHALPAVEQEGRWFYILDEGKGRIFQAFSREVALSYWRDWMDYELTKQAVEDGLLVRLSESSYGCAKCGAILFDVFLHLESKVH